MAWKLLCDPRVHDLANVHATELADLVVLGGMPPRAAVVAGMTLDLLHLDGIELQTSAPLADRIAADAQLARGCTLVLGTPGSPVQRWSCGLRLPTRVPNATAVGADTW